MVSYRIRGGTSVSGTITCLGAKNFVTKAMIAAVLGDEPTTLDNVPAIGDVDITAEMIAATGAHLHRDGTTMLVDINGCDNPQIPLPRTGSNRMPVLLLAALLHRFERVSVPALGGCLIGPRAIDFHVQAMRAFGADVTIADDALVATRTGRLRGTEVVLPYPSVGATETSLLLAVLADGRSVIRGAATEPEVGALVTMLRQMGARIFFTSGRDLVVDGVGRLRGTHVTALGDRIEAASWASLAAAAGGHVCVDGVRPEHLGNFLSHYTAIGANFSIEASGTMCFRRDGDLVGGQLVETDVHPAFSTDWQQPFAVALTQARGITVVHETVYEQRLGYLDTLNRLGASTQVFRTCLGGTTCRFESAGWPHSAVISGATPLRAAGELTVPDLRGGLAYVIAAIVAQGETVLHNVELLERGYGDLAARLAAVGVDIDRA